MGGSGGINWFQADRVKQHKAYMAQFEEMLNDNEIA